MFGMSTQVSALIVKLHAMVFWVLYLEPFPPLISIAQFSITSKLPDLRTFLKNGYAEGYEGVTIKYISGRATVLIVFEDDIEVDRVPLKGFHTHEELHTAMQQAGFVQKDPNERERILQRVHEKQSNQQRVQFARYEYQRLRKQYVSEFRQNVMKQPLDDTLRLDKNDFLVQNYDLVNKKIATTRQDLLRFAQDFLKQSQPQATV